MTAAKHITLADIQTKYQDFYQEVLGDTPDNEVAITSQSSDGTKVFIERNFYLCGFNNIRFKAVGKNRELKSFAKYKAYPTGFYLDVQSIGQRGNGDYLIQEQAYSKLASWLNSLGYDVYHESRLD